MRTWNTVAIVGVGLLGGSVGLALRARKLARRIVGVGRRAASLAAAQKLRAIDFGTTNLAEGVAGAELIILAGPVDTIAKHAAAAARKAAPGAIITDVGSTKAEIVAAVENEFQRPANVKRNVAFVGGHPLAGGEKGGPEAAKADLFGGKLVILTPTPNTSRPALKTVTEFWQALGSRVVELSPADHDAAVAHTSHLPHVAAAALAAATPEEFLPFVASGWLDTTRIAAGDVELWRQILTTNRSHALKSLGKFAKVLQAFRQALQQGDDAELVALLESGKRTRDAVGS